jgi:hypothetical protein
LQLEHLAFVKAIAYNYNHYVLPTQQQLVNLHQTAPAAAHEVQAEEPRSLVVVLRLPQDILFDVWDKYSSTTRKSRVRKRKRPGHYVGNAKVCQGRRPISHVDDEGNYDDLPASTYGQGHRRLVSRDELDETAGNIRMVNDEFLAYTFDSCSSYRLFGRREHTQFYVSWQRHWLGQQQSESYSPFVSNCSESHSDRSFKGLRAYVYITRLSECLTRPS